ncbi:hypothetical protein ALC56_11481 [Trachymyrmex septentrionalis]|uniref:Uncharacterized protein n=1 Tax=Trachymyrmex septentrionalis TaxID=34720 RepID=A0A195F2Q5_9HYME|nr:hypothetical protein ALC56_11481 [Trachymyrmex septentrionalis]
MDEKLPAYFIRRAPGGRYMEDDGGISRDRQHASSRLDSPIVERRLVAVPAGSRTICIAGTRQGEASGLGGVRRATLVSPPCVVAVPEEVFLHWSPPSPSPSSSTSSSSSSAGPVAATTTSATPLHAWRRG